MPDLTPGVMAALHAQCFTFTPRPWPAAEIASLLQDSHVFVIGDSAGFVVGRVVLDEAEVLTLVIVPAQRRMGRGAHLMARFFDESRARGAATAFLEVAADNMGAIALYLQAGFSQSGRRRGYYGTAGGHRTDALIMARPF
jgi:ribosomal-protein-alanine N-acetyltransferase